MQDNERKVTYGIIIFLVVLLIAKHYSMAHEQDLSVACKEQTGYVKHKKIGRSWYCHSGEGHWQKLRRSRNGTG